MLPRCGFVCKEEKEDCLVMQQRSAHESDDTAMTRFARKIRTSFKRSMSSLLIGTHNARRQLRRTKPSKVTNVELGDEDQPNEVQHDDEDDKIDRDDFFHE